MRTASMKPSSATRWSTRRVVVEVKPIEMLIGIHRAQLLSYRKLDGYGLGHLVNFDVSRIKNGVSRMVNRL
jgi:GxxExxY protein